MIDPISRRVVLSGLAATGAVLAGCSRLDDKTPFRQILGLSDAFTLRAQRVLLAKRPLVREFSLSQVSATFPVNGTGLPPGDGAPLRLRVELQIGYKNAKFVDRIEVVDRIDSIGKGRGGWWEDFDRAVWYAGQ